MVKAAPKKTAEATPNEEAPPAEPIVIDPPAEDPEAVIDVNVSPTVADDQGFTPADFRRSGPEYDVNILDNLADGRRGDLKAHRDAIVDAVTEADNRSEALKVFKEDFESHRVLNMPVLNEAVANKQTTAMDLRGQLWKIIKSLPQT